RQRPFGRMPGLANYGLDLRPSLLEILAERLPLLVIEIGDEQAVEVAGALLEDEIMRSVEQRDHRLEQMHLRILPARQRRRESLREAAMRRAQPGVDE